MIQYLPGGCCAARSASKQEPLTAGQRPFSPLHLGQSYLPHQLSCSSTSQHSQSQQQALPWTGCSNVGGLYKRPGAADKGELPTEHVKGCLCLWCDN